MPRPIEQHAEAVNSDSFLDIVASVVSIMIIMVVMEGTRIRNMPVTVAIPATREETELRKDLAGEQALRGDVLRAAEQVRGLRQEIVRRGVQRDMLATMVTAVEDKIARQRQKLDAEKQADFDLARGLAESRGQLDQLAMLKDQAEKASAAPTVVESYPTPISRAVDGPEAHLLIDHGRVAFVPLESLLEQFQAQAKRQVQRLLDQPELTDTVGPVEGFRLRYTLARHDISPEMMKETGRGGSYARLEKWTLIPVSKDLGEPVRLAMEEGSDFRRTLAKILPGRTTITIWVYPEGFEAFRMVRKELYRLNYSIAARPLPPGAAISGSPEGSKSAAQ